MGRVRTFLLVVLAAAVVVGSGCGGSAETGTRSTPRGQPQGSAIAPGFVSPAGTVLLGVPFVSRNIGYGENPVRLQIDAILLVTGDPVLALRDLLEQGSAAGIAMTTYVGDEEQPTFCDEHLLEYGWPVEHQRELPALTCSAEGVSEVVDGIQREVTTRAVVGGQDEPYISFIHVVYRELDIRTQPLPVTAPLPPPPGPSPLEPPEFPSSLPGPGEPLGAPFAPVGEDYEILDGSELLAPPLPSTCSTGGFVAVLQFEGDLDEMFERYDDEVREGAFRGIEPEPGEAFEHQGAQHRYRTYSGAGGGDVELRGTKAPGQPGYLLLERCND